MTQLARRAGIRTQVLHCTELRFCFRVCQLSSASENCWLYSETHIGVKEQREKGKKEGGGGIGREIGEK